MRRKSLKEFIKENRAELDEAIRRAVPNIGSLNDEDRREWILNEPGLYNWAKSEGVKI